MPISFSPEVLFTGGCALALTVVLLLEWLIALWTRDGFKERERYLFGSATVGLWAIACLLQYARVGFWEWHVGFYVLSIASIGMMIRMGYLWLRHWGIIR